MHILVTNDDGPPSSQSSPYVRCLVKHLQSAGHTVSVCLPDNQRSWIGKAHMVGQTLRPLYYRPSAQIHGDDAQGTTHKQPSTFGDVEEWILVDGTPASCVQIGLHHFFQERGPVDLVVSGPNYGRNTTAVFALSSGTLGAALEAAVCGHRAVALSFAFFTRNHDPVIIEAACRHSVRVIEALRAQWPQDGSADLYSVNVPLVEGVEGNPTVFADILQNYWRDGSCFEEIEGVAGDGEDEEESIREGAQGEAGGQERTEKQDAKTGHAHKHFKWAPRFADVYKSVEESGPGSDGWAVKEGQTSITPLKANFATALGDSHQKELKLSQHQDLPSVSQGDRLRVKAIVSYEDSYVQPLILSALSAVFPPSSIEIIDKFRPSGGSFNMASLVDPGARTFAITQYEQIDFDFAAFNRKSCLVNSYMIRKALIRKHYLSTTVDHWMAKNPTSLLGKHFKRCDAFELDYAEFLDDSLVEAFDLRESLDSNAALEQEERTWWILKPGMSDRGQGIRLFSTMDELQAIFDGWEEDRPNSEDEQDDTDDEADPIGDHPAAAAASDYITTSHLRHFVAQPYLHPPLLVDGDDRKFHIRTYVLCTGSLRVHVYKHMLALFAAKPYAAPWECPDDIETFLTNTCLQDSPNENTVRRFWELPLAALKLETIFGQICEVTGTLFEAAARAMPIHFQTLPNAFEVFGLDFLVDSAGNAWLLEVNAFPDFRQTGGDLRDVVAGFWEGVLRHGVAPFFGLGQDDLLDGKGADDMVLVREVDLGRG